MSVLSTLLYHSCHLFVSVCVKFEVDTLYGCHIMGKVIFLSLLFKFKPPYLNINGSSFNHALYLVTKCLCVKFEVDILCKCHVMRKLKFFKKSFLPVFPCVSNMSDTPPPPFVKRFTDLDLDHGRWKLLPLFFWRLMQEWPPLRI